MLRRKQKALALSALVILLFVLAAVFAPFLTPYRPDDMDLLSRLSPPSAAHLLGTDEGGCDVLTRLLYGARVSLLVGVVPTLLSMILGTFLGILAGYRGGILGHLIMRLADVLLALPTMLLAMFVM